MLPTAKGLSQVALKIEGEMREGLCLRFGDCKWPVCIMAWDRIRKSRMRHGHAADELDVAREMREPQMAI